MPASYRPLPPSETLWELFSYNPLTGHLHRRFNRRHTYVDRQFGCRFNNGYIIGEIDSVKYAAHRLIWKWFYGSDPHEIDHVNRCRNDNRIWNLRNVSRSGNHCNRGYVRGWTKQPSGKYYALIGVHGKQHYLGSFSTEEEARAAYEEAAARLHAPLLNSCPGVDL